MPARGLFRLLARIVPIGSIIASMIGAPGAAHAEVRALLVGVSQFSSPMIRDLKGPANDLAAMEALVRGQGATDVTVLRDDQVTRTTMETALHALGLRSRPGDWIVFYYSGHGAQADAAIKGTRDGDFDQFVPLPQFDLDRQDAERFVVDKDFYAWFARYIPTSVQMLMIADTCHSGSMHRSADARAFRFDGRLAFRGDSSGIALIARPAPRFDGVLGSMEQPGETREVAASYERADLPNVIFMAAAQDDQLALEAAMPAEGSPSRGLLTYAFEQGLTTRAADGKALAADLDADGAITVSEMAIYVDSQVRSMTGQRQQPRTSYVTGKEKAQLFVTPVLPPLAPVAPPLPGLFALDSGAKRALATPPTGQAAMWTAAASAETADYQWSASQGIVLRRTGDLVAQNVGTLAALRGVVEKWDAVDRLRPLLNEARAQVIVGPGANGARHRAGARVAVSLKRADGPMAGAYATVFNLASDGTVQLLYPLDATDGDGRPADSSAGGGSALPLIESEVVAPYGTDHVVALVSGQPPVELRALLRTLDNQRGAGKLVAPLRAALAAEPGHASLSIGEIYTGP